MGLSSGSPIFLFIFKIRVDKGYYKCYNEYNKGGNQYGTVHQII